LSNAGWMHQKQPPAKTAVLVGLAEFCADNEPHSAAVKTRMAKENLCIFQH